MIYIHIGLPKTATTSLQKLLYLNQSKLNINYLGVCQPRGESKEHILYESIMSCMNSQSSIALKENLSIVKKTIDDVLIDCEAPLFISEEMFTVDNLGITWQEKLSRLYAMVEGVEHKIIVTIREPVSSLHSFYTEIYHSVKDEFATLHDFCMRSNNAKVYNYNLLDDELNLLFSKRDIFYFRFEDLIRPGGVNDFFKRINMTLHCKISTENVKRKLSDGSYTRKEKFSELIDKVNINYRFKVGLLSLIGDYDVPLSARLIKKLSGNQYEQVVSIFSSSYYER